MVKQILSVVAAIALLAFATSAGASTLLEVIELPQGENVNSIDDLVLFDEFDPEDLVKPDGDPLYYQSFYSDSEFQGCDFGSDSACNFNVDQYVEYVVVKAARYAALYEPWDGEVHVDTADWGLYKNNGRAFTPGISNVRAINAVPEPNAAVVFVAGLSIVGAGVRRLRLR